jgi:hypothetical protein
MNIKSEKSMVWAKQNPERYKLNQQRYRERKKQLMTDEMKQIERIKNRERNKIWKINNREKYRKLRSKYERERKLSDPIYKEKAIIRKREWDKKNKDYIKNYSRERYKSTYVFKKDKILIYARNKNYNNRLEVIYWYSDGLMKCNVCGETNYEFLAIDHINNDGYKHRRDELKKYSNNIINYCIINKFPEGYQILCHNCNQIKRIENISVVNNSYKKYRDKIRNLMLQKYSNGDIQCKCCKIKDIRCLTFHHVRGGGAQEKVREKYSSLSIYLYKNNISLFDIEILCQNCNKSIGHYGYCPHK